MSSTGGGKKGGPKGSKKGSDDASDRATPASMKSGSGAGTGAGSAAGGTSADPDMKDDGNVDDKKDGKGEEATTPKPPVSAAQTQRDAAQKAMNLALKQEWTPLEQTLKSMEKFIAAGGEEVTSNPLAGVMDPVSVVRVN